MATVAKAFEDVSIADLIGLKQAAQAMGTTAFELLAGGTLANWVAVLNSLIVVKGGATGNTAVDSVPTKPVTALVTHAPFKTLERFRMAVTDADPTEFDALTGDTRANVLAWLADAQAILRYNSDIASSAAGWTE
jgi:hypothetical protein